MVVAARCPAAPSPLPDVFPADLEELVRFGEVLNRRPESLRGKTVVMALTEGERQLMVREGLDLKQIGFRRMVRVRRGVVAGDLADVKAKLRALRRVLEEPNASESFRTLIEQVIEDALTGGYGAIEMEATGDCEQPVLLWPVDGASIRINAKWDGRADSPRYAQVMPIGKDC